MAGNFPEPYFIPSDQEPEPEEGDYTDSSHESESESESASESEPEPEDSDSDEVIRSEVEVVNLPSSDSNSNSNSSSSSNSNSYHSPSFWVRVLEPVSEELEYEEEGSQKGFGREDMEGLCCPICIEPWSNGGLHLPSCLPCGHLFGMSCIKKWLGQQRNSGKCPQCNKKCAAKDVRRIYGSRVVVVDENSQKRIQFLEAKCESLEKKNKEWHRKKVEWDSQVLAWQKEEAKLRQKLQEVTERTNDLERALGDVESKSLSLIDAFGFEARSTTGNKAGMPFGVASSCTFALQQEVLLDDARCFDIDDFNKVLFAARSPVRIGGPRLLTKVSLFSPREQANVQLPSSIGAVRDLRTYPFGRLALLASMGKKLAVFSMENNNIVLNYDLPAAAWSCSWDINSSHYSYAGLQNGMLLVFDMRQTQRPLESKNGLASNPVHTVYSLSDSAAQTGIKRVLTASSVGVCQWDIDVAQEQPVLITEAMNHGVCISLAYCPDSDYTVSTFRPRVEMPDETTISQPSQAYFSNNGQYVLGSHVLMKRVDSSFRKLGSKGAYVPGVRLPKSTILNMENAGSLFASGDEATTNLVLQEFPSLSTTQTLQSYYPIRDVKYTTCQKLGLLCCLGGNKMQFFQRSFL